MWIDHLHKADQALIDLLLGDYVITHPLVVEELALGSLARRDEMLQMMAGLSTADVLAHHELISLVGERGLWGIGLSPTDAHLLGSALLSEGTRIWTRDTRLRSAADDLDVSYAP